MDLLGLFSFYAGAGSLLLFQLHMSFSVLWPFVKANGHFIRGAAFWAIYYHLPMLQIQFSNNTIAVTTTQLGQFLGTQNK